MKAGAGPNGFEPNLGEFVVFRDTAVISVIIGLNILIALLGFYLAWRIWCLRQTLAGVAKTLGEWDCHLHDRLNPEVTPGHILLARRGTAQIRQQYAHLQHQLRLLRMVWQVLSILPILPQSLQRWSSLGANPRKRKRWFLRVRNHSMPR